MRYLYLLLLCHSYNRYRVQVIPSTAYRTNKDNGQTSVGALKMIQIYFLIYLYVYVCIYISAETNSNFHYSNSWSPKRTNIDYSVAKYHALIC